MNRRIQESSFAGESQSRRGSPSSSSVPSSKLLSRLEETPQPVRGGEAAALAAQTSAQSCEQVKTEAFTRSLTPSTVDPPPEPLSVDRLLTKEGRLAAVKEKLARASRTGLRRERRLPRKRMKTSARHSISWSSEFMRRHDRWPEHRRRAKEREKSARLNDFRRYPHIPDHDRVARALTVRTTASCGIRNLRGPVHQ